MFVVNELKSILLDEFLVVERFKCALLINIYINAFKDLSV